MSRISIARFWKAVHRDPRLRAEYEALTRGCDTVPAALIVALGERHGYAITKDDLRRMPGAAMDGELSEEQLESVAGGMSDEVLEFGF